MLYSLCEADFEVAMIVNVEIFLFNFVVGFFLLVFDFSSCLSYLFVF